jgi:hypothetical protein
MKYEQYNNLARFLKSKYKRKLNIVRVRLRNDGWCIKDGNDFSIRINRGLSEELAIETLIHEFAHILSWQQEDDDHGPKWGIAYSKVYRLFLEFLKQNKK